MPPTIGKKGWKVSCIACVAETYKCRSLEDLDVCSEVVIAYVEWIGDDRNNGTFV